LAPEAADDLERIIERVRRYDPRAARALVNRIFERCASLQTVPNRGRIAGTRELVLALLPYIAVYRVKPDAVEIVRIYHGAQNWP
jgi:toxin ParE1/3/4